MPGQTVAAQYVEERIGVELFYVHHAGAGPLAGEHHHGTCHGGYAGGVAHALGTGFFVGGFVAAVVPDVVGALLAVFDATDAAADAGLAGVVFAEATGVGQYRLEEFEGDDFHTFVHDGGDAGHTDVLDDAQVGQVLIAEGHPEARPFEGGEVLDERLQLLVVNQVRIFGADVGVVDDLHDLVGFGFYPLAVFPVAAFLRDLADVDFRVEVGGEGFAMVACIGIDDVEVMDFIEEVLGGAGGEDARHAGVETAAEDGEQPFFAEPLLVGPLPTVLELGFIAGFVVGGIEVVDAGFEAGIHDGQVLVRQGHVDDHGGLVAADEGHQLGHVVGIHRSSGDVGIAQLGADVLRDDLALRYRPAGQ